jgi:hypothetical protein
MYDFISDEIYGTFIISTLFLGSGDKVGNLTKIYSEALLVFLIILLVTTNPVYKG